MKCKPHSSQQVLLVSSEDETLASCKHHLQDGGLTEIVTLNDSRDVLPVLAAGPVAVAVLDLSMPDVSSFELLSKVVKDPRHVPVIILANNQVETAVECIKLGAFDYLAKPVHNGRLIESVKKALAESTSAEATLKNHLPEDDHLHLGGFELLVTANRKMRELFRYIELVAASRQPILITGETGVGKELVAKAIHRLSSAKGEFVALNAAGLDDTMFSDALFGHHKGAYTGADQSREGLVSRAAGGTLFLDEIGDLNEMSQIKLLRLLQEGEYYPVGSDTTRKSEAHIVVATNRDLQKRMTEGKFRNDLYYRLCSHQIKIPPLRERKDDLPLLLEHFIAGMSQRLGIAPPAYQKKIIELLQGHDFPGNVRELQGMVDDAVICSKGGIISQEPFLRSIALEHLSPEREEHSGPALQAEGSLQQMLEAVWGHFPTLHEAEELLIGTALQVSNGNQRIAASMLGLNRQTLNMRLKVRRNGKTADLE